MTDSATAVEGGAFTPSPGAVSICVYCSRLAIFTGVGFESREPTEAEREAMAADKGVQLALSRLEAYRRRRNAWLN